MYQKDSDSLKMQIQIMSILCMHQADRQDHENDATFELAEGKKGINAVNVKLV